jgi:hypothetical protein
MYACQRTHHRFGLGVSASAEDVALRRGGDVFEQKNPAAGFAVDDSTEGVWNAPPQGLTAIAAEQQFAFDFGGAFLFDDERDRSGSLCFRDDAMYAPAEAVVSTDARRGDDRYRAPLPNGRSLQCTTQPARREERIAGRDPHARQSP